MTKTSLCRAWSKNACPLPKEECKFAHGASDLRVTAWYEKIAMCQAFKHGRCTAGSDCRFAHSPEELQVDETAANAAMFAPVGGKGAMQPPWLGDPSAMGWPGQGMPSGEGMPDYQMPYMMPGGMMPGGMMPNGMMPVMMQGPQVPEVPKADDEAARKADVQLMVKLKTGGSVKFKIKAATALRKLMDAFCTRKNLERSEVKFFVGDAEIFPDDTALKLGLTEDSVILADNTVGDS